ncbi:sigma-54-dependent Fis family transcriptional regulator [Shewanella gelidii]|uniref:Sigma-54-dependent Fis family transcriptional regulator n=1 Tax=Shewanella gelidii TaxID=1642821 RepID=A0A917NA43_9GAMM|nr:sigma-54-dependent Fis family transcriptional regulator [Shewanella gelidii]MCL1098491.1 sigma-54-dependent Fis family transcriptional regulator [Shewanella gelidii]GGI82348.1 sigma-54-dependent Fis family transcriptional regulator [Shewanella gelidii]
MSLKSSQDWLTDSWSRSQASGLLETAKPDDYRLSNAGLEHKRHLHQQLIELVQSHAVPLFKQLMAHSASRLILSDRDGFVLQYWGAEQYSNKMATVALDAGVNWHEQHKGTNAIGTALAARQAVSVIGEQHFFSQHRFMSCSACPIFSPSGDLVAVLDITSEQQKHSQQTLMLVSSLAQQVETALLCHLPDSHYRVDVAAQSNLVHSGWQGIVVADREGKLLGCNPMAKQLLTRPQIGDDLAKHFGQDWNLARSISAAANLHVQTQSLPQIKAFKHPRVLPARQEPTKNQQVEVRFHDPKLERAWQQANKVVSRSIPLLILGETGVGKEQFVKKLHSQSARQQHPLVAVNCAAIPAELVESELFGYQAGAFTGASRTGFVGKIREAHRGFLFLDEIGEMPLAAQGRLLRVLQEREVTPIGSNSAYKVDIQVVAATHTDLPSRVAQGLFREDLYYRLNGLLVSLPPLRERLDKNRIIHKLHRRYGDSGQQISPQLLNTLSEYHWPGNLRELDNLMQVACLMAEGQAQLQWHHLSDLQQQLLLRQPTTTQLEPSAQTDAADSAFHHQYADNSVPARQAPISTTIPIQQTVEAEVRQVYLACQGNVSAAAKQLGVSRNTLYRKLKKFGLR